MADPSDFHRLLGDLLTIGIVASVDHASGTAQVDIGEIRTGDLPWTTARAGAARIWCPPAIGEQVLVFSPEGDLDGGLIVASLSYDRFPAPVSDGSTRIEFEDGTWVGYNPGAGVVTVEATTRIHLIGDVTIAGDVILNGKLTASDDVVAAGKSLRDHVHTRVQPGQGVSGGPQ